MHLLAEKEILTGLKAGGLLKGDVDEMVDYRIGALFMPHGDSLLSHGEAMEILEPTRALPRAEKNDSEAVLDQNGSSLCLDA